MTKVIRDMLLKGYTAVEIAEIATQEERKLEEEKSRAAAAVEDAKVKMIEATANYMLAAGLLSKEEIEDIDWDYIDKGFSLIEKMFLPTSIKTQTNTHEPVKVNVISNCSSRPSDIFESLLDEILKIEKEGN